MGVKGRWSRLWVDTAEFSTRVMSATLNTQVSTEDITAWQDTAKRSVGTGSESSLELNGYLEALGDNAGGLDRMFYRRFGVDSLSNADVCAAVMFAESASAEAGAPCYVFPKTYTDQVTIASPATGVQMINGAFRGGQGRMRRGLLLWRGEITATGTKAGVDFVTAGLAGGNAYMFVSAITGTATNATVAIESSVPGAYVTEATLTFSGTGVQTASIAGAIGSLIRINTTSMGGATAFTIAVIACVNGVTQPA